MNWFTAAMLFLSGLVAGWKAKRAAKAGSELPQGEAQVKAADENVTAIEAELRRGVVSPVGRPN